jgi:putative flippase GtrA
VAGALDGTRRSGRLGQGVRFVVAGGLVALIYLGITTGLADAAGVPFQLALAVGFATAICAHFCLQRFFVWVHERGYALSLRAQMSRYLMLVVVQYGSTAAVTTLLPRLLHLSATAVYIPWTLFVSGVNFVVFGTGIFHPERHRAAVDSR